MKIAMRAGTTRPLYEVVRPNMNPLAPIPQMYSQQVSITPDAARQLLVHNVGNRTLYMHKVREYAQMMANDQWKSQNPEGIILGPSGRVLQGQHRLHAIVLSGCTILMWVTFNAPEDIYDVLDTGQNRGLADRVGSTKKIQRITNSMFNSFQGKYAGRQRTHADVDNFYRKHREVIEWAGALWNADQNGLRRPQYAAILARAAYHHPRLELERFADIVINGAERLSDVRAGDRSALKLREHVFRMRSGPGGRETGKFYGIVERSLRSFLNNQEPAKELTPVPQEIWLVPGEELEVVTPPKKKRSTKKAAA